MKMTREEAEKTNIAFAVKNNAITHHVGDLLVKELDKEVEVDGVVYEFTDYDFYEYKEYEHELLYRVRVRKNAEPWNKVDITKAFRVEYLEDIYCRYDDYGSKQFEVEIGTTSYGSKSAEEMDKIIKYLKIACSVAEFVKALV